MKILRDTLSDYKEAGDDDINTPPVDSDNDGVPDYLQFDEVEDDEDSEDDPPAEEEGVIVVKYARAQRCSGTFIALMALWCRRKRNGKGHRCITKNDPPSPLQCCLVFSPDGAQRQVRERKYK